MIHTAHDPRDPESLETARATSRGERLREVAWLFLRLGATAFGGPLAHIAMMQREVVERGWVTREELLDLIGVTNLLPGPNSTEMAIHLGHKRAGAPGLIVAGVCFIVPAALITVGLAWMYVRFGKLPETAAVLYGTKPVIVAIVAQALVNLARTAVKRTSLAVLGAAAIGAVLLGVNEIAVLFAAGLAAALIGSPPRDPKTASPPGDPKTASPPGDPKTGSPPGDPKTASPPGDPKTASPPKDPKTGSLPDGPEIGSPPGPAKKDQHGLFLLAGASATGSAGAAAAAAAATGAAPFGLLPLFTFFVKIGAVLFGSGYVLLAFLRADLVDRMKWLTEAQLLDAVTAGQITPGPVFTTATFVGYLLGGGPGAVVATTGIFLPAFVFVAASGPIVRRIRSSPRAGAFLDGVNVASLALMAVVSAQLGRAAIIDPVTVLLALASLAILLRWKPNATWLVLAGALLGLAVKSAHG